MCVRAHARVLVCVCVCVCVQIADHAASVLEARNAKKLAIGFSSEL